MQNKPVLIGMNNPLHTGDKYALYPWPPRCAGHRLLEMLRLIRPETTRREYIERFDRRNLCIGSYDRKRATEAAAAMQFTQDQPVVLLGNEVAAAFGQERHPIHPVRVGSAVMRQVPHPSGLNRFYNSEYNRLMVGLLLEELFHGT